jgi:hypothetical protein
MCGVHTEPMPACISQQQDPPRTLLNVFGSIAYGEIPDSKRTKLEDKIKKYVFIGYSEKSKAYKLYDPIEKKLMINRDVELNEEAR